MQYILSEEEYNALKNKNGNFEWNDANKIPKIESDIIIEYEEVVDGHSEEYIEIGDYGWVDGEDGCKGYVGYHPVKGYNFRVYDSHNQGYIYFVTEEIAKLSKSEYYYGIVKRWAYIPE